MTLLQKALFGAEGLHKYTKRALAKHGCSTLRVLLMFHPADVTIKVAPAKASRRKGASDRMSRERFTLRVRLVFHPTGVTAGVTHAKRPVGHN